MSPWSIIRRVTAAEHGRLTDALGDCAGAQRRLLAELLQRNADSAYGRRHRFAAIGDPDRYRQQVPLCDYADLAADIDATAAAPADAGARLGKRLLAEPVTLFEQTGGSSGGRKLVPYSESSLTGFRRALYPWLHDLANRYPGLGGTYFAISPAGRAPRSTAGGIPIGAADTVYFGRELAAPLARISLAPPSAETELDIGQWQLHTLTALLGADDLTLISIWSPSFITGLLDALTGHADTVLRAIADGERTPGRSRPPRPARARQVERALAAAELDTHALWPRLQLLSCWTDAAAARYLPELRRRFRRTAIQGKGLLATEGVSSVPLGRYRDPVLAVNSAFFEFLDPDGRSHLAAEVRPGQAYELVISVPGFYRYRCGDRVQITGRAGSAPQLRFIGRTGVHSDLVGEKLDDAFVTDCLRGLEGFALLVPASGPPSHYRLYCQTLSPQLTERVERALRRNPQYAYARDLGQLGPLTPIAAPAVDQAYRDWALARGQRLGDIKPPSLCPQRDWQPAGQ